MKAGTMLLKITALLAVAYLLLTPPAQAQEPFMFHYSVKNGLPSKEVHHIFEDSKGYIWICTDAGIAKYNANSFKIFDSSNGLPDNTVFEVFEDKYGRIWYRTYTGGIGYISGDSVYTVKANKKITELQSQGIIESFAIDKNDDIVLGTKSFDKCFFIRIAPPYDEKNISRQFSKNVQTLGIDVMLLNKRVVFSELRSKDLIADYSGPGSIPVFISMGKGKVYMKDTTLIKQTGSLSKFYVAGDNILYVSKSVLKQYNIATKKISRRTNPYDLVTVLKDGDVLITGSRDNGVIEIASSSNTVKTAYLEGKTVNTIMKDSRNGYWYGTMEDGVYYCPDKEYYKIHLLKSTAKKEEASCFLRINDSVIVVGTENGRVYRCTIGQNKKIKEELIFENTAYGKIAGIIKFSNSKIILASARETAAVVDLATKKTVNIHTSLFKSGFLFNNCFAGAIVKNVVLIDTTTFTTQKDINMNARITKILADAKNRKLLVGTLKGLYETDPGQPEPSPKALLNTRVEDLLIHDDLLFVATKSNGLIVKNGDVTDTITVKNNLISNVCRKLFYIQGELWLISSKGVSRILYSGYKHYVIKNFPFTNYIFPESIDNMAGIKNALLFLDKGDLFFYPVLQKHSKEHFRMGSIYVNGVAVKNLKTGHLRYDQSNILVNLDALFFENNGSISYRYKFKGRDPDWKYSGKPVLEFPALAPGNYTLMIQARDHNDVWIDCEQELAFSIDPPFWLEWWFIALEIMVTLGIIAFIIFKRYKVILEKERVKNALRNRFFEMEIKVLKVQMDPHFIFNSLNSIQQFIIIRDNEKAQAYLSKFSRLLRKLLESNTNENIRLSDEIGILGKYLEIESLRFNNVFEYEIVVKSPIDPETTFIPHFMIQPFVENSIWHGLLPKAGNKRLIITFEKTGSKSIACTIEDNGVGRRQKEFEDPEERRAHAISLIRQRLLLMSTDSIKYNVTILDKMKDDVTCDGTKVIVLLPVLNN